MFHRSVLTATQPQTSLSPSSLQPLLLCIYKLEMARTVTCLRYFLIGYVIILGMSGVGVSVGSGFFIYQLQVYEPLTPEKVSGPSITLLVIGVLTCLLNCCGWRFIGFTNRTQVLLLAGFLSLFAFVETSAGIWALVRHEQIVTLTSGFLKEAFAHATTHEKDIWERMQIRLACCGIDGPTDYRDFKYIPTACCDTTHQANDNTKAGTCTRMYSQGCTLPVINRTRSILLHVFLLALCSVILKCVGVMFCFGFSSALKKSSERRRQENITLQTYSKRTPTVPSKARLLPPSPTRENT